MESVYIGFELVGSAVGLIYARKCMWPSGRDFIMGKRPHLNDNGRMRGRDLPSRGCDGDQSIVVSFLVTLFVLVVLVFVLVPHQL